MRWKSVALAVALGPAAAGCNIAKNAARNIVNEPLVVCTQQCIEHDLRKHANAAWREVRDQYPRRAFTAEFRDGFVDGYVDYLDRGGNGSLPAVPPAKYTRHKKYFTENGQCLVKDYFLGFKYGQEIAIATGRRQFLTVPVLLPVAPEGPPAFVVPQPAPPPQMVPPREPPGVVPVPAVVPVPPGLPGLPGLPDPKPVPKPGSDAPPSKFGPPAPPADPNTLPPPSPPVPELPAALPPAVGVSVPVVKLPAPPPEVPEFPAHVPTPSTVDELPVVPPTHTEPPTVAPSHPEAVGM